MGFVGDQLQRVRSLIPVRALPGLARRRVDALWDEDGFRNLNIDSMTYLLEHTERASEIPQLARDYAEFALLRGYRRWHPKLLASQPIRDIEWLTTKRDPKRGVLINFMHHAQYDGIFSSLGREGVPADIIVAPEAFDPASPIQLRQHFKAASIYPVTRLVPATIGTAGMVDLLNKGGNLAIASDVAGKTPINFMGRDMLGSFGAARLASEANVPVILVSSHQGEDGRPVLQVHEPIEPSDFAGPGELLAEIIRLHEPAVLAWPAAYDAPYTRLGLPAEAAAQQKADGAEA